MLSSSKYTIRDVLEFKFQSLNTSWGPLVSVHENTLVMDAVKLMKDHGFKYLPVFRYQRYIDKPTQLIYTGILSIQDVLDYLVFHKIFEDLEYPLEFDTDAGFKSYLKQLEEKFAICGIRVQEIQGRVKESSESIQECLLSLSEPIYTLLDRFIKGDHRVLVRDPSDCLKIAMLTQTDLLKFLLANERSMFSLKAIDAAERAMKTRGPSDLSADPNQPVNVKKHVLTVSMDMNALCAFKMMNIHRISSLGVVNSKRELVGVISATDLLKVDWNRLEDLLLSIQDFKELGDLVTTDPNSKLETVAQKALKKSIHGVYIVDDQNHPTGIIRFSDIFSMLLV